MGRRRADREPLHREVVEGDVDEVIRRWARRARADGVEVVALVRATARGRDVMIMSRAYARRLERRAARQERRPAELVSMMSAPAGAVAVLETGADGTTAARVLPLDEDA